MLLSISHSQQSWCSTQVPERRTQCHRQLAAAPSAREVQRIQVITSQFHFLYCPVSLSSVSIDENRPCRIPTPLIKVLPFLLLLFEIGFISRDHRWGRATPRQLDTPDENRAWLQMQNNLRNITSNKKRCSDIFLAEEASVISQKTSMRNSQLISRLP